MKSQVVVGGARPYILLFLHVQEPFVSAPLSQFTNVHVVASTTA